ncbi:MAG: DUF2953 domain-containing protein [Firmicutes bacterium]|jgi:hypothetical protein|nr:DUF2953 domain-containing protein [Bacillota bacterium]
MKWVFPFLTLSIAAFALAVFATHVHVRIQLTLNRSQTLASVSFGILNGLIWFTVYRTEHIQQLDEDGQGELIISALEELITHPENVPELLSRFIVRIITNKPRQDVKEDKLGETQTPRDRFIRPIIVQTLKRGLHIVRLRVQLYFGTGDAATTGIAVGSIYTLIGTAMAVLSRRLRFPHNPPEITVVPCYNRVCVDLDFDSIVLLRPSDIVFQAIFG